MKCRSGFQALLPLAMVLLGARPARADVVGPPPESCPAGSLPDACHGGPYCWLEKCTTDADCNDGKTCQSLSLCTSMIDCGGLGGPDTTINVLSACNGSCAEGTCSTLQACSKGVSPTGSGGGGNGGSGGGGGDDLAVTGCACSLDNGSALGGVAGALLFAVGLAGLRGRRRSGRPAK